MIPPRTARCAVSIVAQPAPLWFESFVAGVLAHDGRRALEHLPGAATPADALLPIQAAGLAATAGRNQKVELRLRHWKLALRPLATVLREAGVGWLCPPNRSAHHIAL